MSTTTQSRGLAEPPEGAIRGESVPAGSEPEQYDEAQLRSIMGALKGQSEAFRRMGESELREAAIEWADAHGVSL